jgi:Ca-activated chloride channel homolog
MAGRHLPSGSQTQRGPFTRSRIVIGTAVLATAAITGCVLAVALPGRHDATAAENRCAQTVTVTVIASPSIASEVETVGSAWAAGHPVVAGRCVTVTTHAEPDVKAESEIAGGSASAAVWIPDSTTWVQRLNTDLGQAALPSLQVHTYPSIASSPLTVVAPIGRITQEGNVAPTNILQAAVTGSVPLTVADPVANADGLLGLLAMRSMLGGTSASSNADVIGLMVRLAHQSVPSSAAAVQAMTAPDAMPVVASEQTAITENRGKDRPVVGAIYPNGGSLSLDYPVVTLSRGSDDPALAPALAQYQRMLRAISAQQVFTAAGFRDPAGDPIEISNQLGTNTFKAISPPSVAETEGMLRAWSAAETDSHTLAVIDTSGSMGDNSGNGKSKIRLAADAAADALQFFPDASSFGLWSFSGDQGTPTPWTQLRAVAPLGSSTGGHSQRAALVSAAGQLPDEVGGDTALYDTTLAAFSQIRNTYVSGAVNSVVLLTDGQNDYPQGMSLSTLVSRLRSLSDAAHPVPIITIGIGNQADVAVLRQISALTGGKTYVVKNPDDIKGVFLDAMLQRQCRPNCSMGS